MNLEELLRQANEGNMVAQYDLAEYYGKLLKETEDEDEIFTYSREAMIWLKKSAKQGYGPAVDAMSELDRGMEAQEPDLLEEAAAETAAAVTAAVDNYEDESFGAEPSAAAPAKAVPEKKADGGEKPGFWAANGNTILSCMLAISLLLNILLLIFLFRLTKERRSMPLPTPTPISISETMEPTEQPTAEPTPEVSAEPTEEPSPEPTGEPTPEPTEPPFWMDLSAYPTLDLKPSQEDLYTESVPYLTTAGSLNVRSGPDTRYAKLDTISGGSRVEAVSKYGNWYLVSYEDRKLGWVSGNYLTDDLNWKPEATPRATENRSSSGDLKTW